MARCKFEGCDKEAVCKGHCRMHYQQNKYSWGARPLGTNRLGLFIEEVINTDTEACVEWPYSKRSLGYGLVRIKGKLENAHRYVCTLVHGEPAHNKMVAMHSCDNPSCINPRHLRWGTQSENVKEMWEKGRRS